MHFLVIYLAMLLGAFCTIVALTAMRRREKHNVGKAGWLVLVLLTPPLGLILFILFSGKKVSAEHESREPIDLPEGDQAKRPGDALQLTEIAELRGIPLPAVNHFVFHSTPETMYRALFELIRSAQKRIYIHTFILSDDSLGTEIINELCESAKRGVEVRLMIDGFGSFLFPDHLLTKLQDVGGHAVRFKPLSRLSKFAYSNFRNHRKMVIADGNRALIGGANLVEHEITHDAKEDTWIDFLLEISGLVARQTEAVFLSDWKFACGEDVPRTTDPVEVFQADGRSTAVMQTIPVGPDGADEVLDDLWLTAINRARERVWITTPYFVPPPMATRSLAIAARRGVDVRVLVPDKSDMPPADYARFDYATDLTDIGAKIFRLPNRMIHAKCLLIDRDVAYLGSANMDMRSFFLNYELVVGMFSPERIDEIASWFLDLSNRCETGPAERTKRRASLSVLARIFAEQM